MKIKRRYGERALKDDEEVEIQIMKYLAILILTNDDRFQQSNRTWI